jgi:hypothetical protein
MPDERALLHYYMVRGTTSMVFRDMYTLYTMRHVVQYFTYVFVRSIRK